MWREVSDSITAKAEPDNPTAPRPDPEPPVRGAWVPTDDAPVLQEQPSAEEPGGPTDPSPRPATPVADDASPTEVAPGSAGPHIESGAFDLDGPVLAHAQSFVVRPSASGGWALFTRALARLLATATDEGLWWATIAQADESVNPAFAHLGPDEGGELYTEVAGDYYLPVAARLNDEQRTTLRALGWADPVADLSGDDEIQPRNHTRSWPMNQLDDACEHVITTLHLVYGFSEDDAIGVWLDPFA